MPSWTKNMERTKSCDKWVATQLNRTTLKHELRLKTLVNSWASFWRSRFEICSSATHWKCRCEHKKHIDPERGVVCVVGVGACRLYLDLKVVVCVREEDHFLFIPELRVIWLDLSADPPPLTTQSHHHLVRWCHHQVTWCHHQAPWSPQVSW